MDDVGAFLRSRREKVGPELVGLASTGRRRTPGLRREEVAGLAGISADYYLRLEQGRGGTPSGQVVEALSRALRLDADEHEYLQSLIRPTSYRLDPPARVVADVERLLDALEPMPAFAQNVVMDVLASNQAARRLSPHNRPGVNLLRAAFLEDYDRSIHSDWPSVAAEAVGHLRALARPVAHTDHFRRFVGELSERSPEFAELWRRQDVVPQSSGVRLVRHPVVGELCLRFSKLDLPGSVGVQVVVHHAEPGSSSAERLQTLTAHRGE